jgi:hypothetical protein|tara:strand:+ start:240 stop:749 length:510 start_codon:yes stop_codon:yes gene_type:complete
MVEVTLKLPATNELDKFRNLLDNKDKLVKQEAKDGTRNQYQIEIQRLKKRYGKDFKKLLSQARKMPKGSGKSTPVTGAGERKEQKFLDEQTPFASQMNAILGNKESLVEKGNYGSKIQTLKDKIKAYNADHELVGKEKVKFKDVLRKSQLSKDINKKDEKASSAPKGSR